MLTRRTQRHWARSGAGLYQGAGIVGSANVIRVADVANLTLDANANLVVTALGSWSKSPAGLTVATGQADPDGGTGAIKLTDTTDGSAVDHFLFNAPAQTANGHYRFTVRIKADSTATGFRIQSDNAAARFFVNPATGGSYQVPAYTSVLRGWVDPDPGVNGTGWWLVTLEFKRAAGDNLYLALSTIAADNSFNLTYQGTSAKSIFLFQPTLTRIGATASAQVAGGGNSAVQGTAAQRPESTAERAWCGGLNALVWPADATRSLTLHALASTWNAAQPFTLLWVGEVQAHAGDAALVTLSHSTGTGVFKPAIFTAAGGVTCSRTTDANVTTTGTYTTVRTNARHVMAVTYDGTNAQLYVDGVAVGSPVALGGGAASFDQLTFGGANLHVRERDCRLFARALSPGEVTVASSYLATMHSSSTQPWRVWLLAGQSNAVGYTAIHQTAPAGYQWQREGLLWQRLGDPAYITSPWGQPRDTQNQSGTGGPCWAGPELGFLQTLNVTGMDRVALTKYAVIATALGGAGAGVWNKASGALYAKWQTAVSDSLAALGVPYTIAGLLWCQGEQDAADATNAANYQANLTQFYADVRADFGLRDIAMMRINSTLPAGTYPHVATVQAAQDAVAAADSNVWIVNPDALTTMADQIHLNGAAQVKLGIALATAARDHVDVVAS